MAIVIGDREAICEVPVSAQIYGGVVRRWSREGFLSSKRSPRNWSRDPADQVLFKVGKRTSFQRTSHSRQAAALLTILSVLWAVSLHPIYVAPQLPGNPLKAQASCRTCQLFVCGFKKHEHSVRACAAAATGQAADGSDSPTAPGTPFRAVLQAAGSEEAIAAFAARFPQVAASQRPDYMGTSCSKDDLRRRFQSLAACIGRDEVLDIVRAEPLLLVVQEDNIKASWLALLRIAASAFVSRTAKSGSNLRNLDEEARNAALAMVRRHPASLTCAASEIAGKSLDEFEATADLLSSFKPVGDKLREIGPEGLAAGAAVLGLGALGALANKVAQDSAKDRAGTFKDADGEQ
ncbi:unnamed protein product [Polarella glacialis]|uniref:Uncharacterized protein n=3 Tax=Polarella glacialis TaxID=89957 RepID=A0A813KRG9_POLGL|nr:unnamed protein product [Polarella glacialis]